MTRFARAFTTIVAVTTLLFVSAPPGELGSARAASPSRITIAFTGDDLATGGTWPQAKRNAGGHGYDFGPMLARLRPLLRSVDVAICHLETPLAGPGVRLSEYPRYAVPPQLAGAIKRAGYDGCSTASNHSLDQGAAGIRTTLRRLDALGLGHTGTARSARERGRTAMYSVGGVKIAHLSFTASFNGLTPTAPWQANRIDPSRILHDARDARRRGADVVVVSLHWGEEFHHDPTVYQRDVAARLLRGDAIDLIVGHHAHVVQPIRRVGGDWVAYGMGNSFSGMREELSHAYVEDGFVLVAVFERGPHGWHVEKLRFAPTWVTPGTFVVRLVGPAIDAGALPGALLSELRRSWRRTVGYVDAKRLGVWPIRAPKI
jgi:poly-gamma-glutamate capsule biosynthesis protein CapA/YwtB (metallophosphatase superfamily)